ncbi:MAG: HAMP domain-containing histidine kinase [Elusimicrobia bacterium]|nr:HAMP domain-containing histidine kinase [Elusimicrobiota bacterium]
MKAPRKARLREALAELETLRRRYETERELVARVSHQFRTPLAAIKGFAETLRRGGLRDRRRRLEFVQTIEKHSDWLSRIVEGLLTVHGIESRRHPLRPRRLELRAYLRRFAVSLAPVARKRRVRLAVEDGPGLVAWGDPDHLERALQSLCENAIGHARTAVELRAWPEARASVVEIRDDGPGIPEELLPRLFDGLSRAPAARRRHGTGLGLRIARCAVEANGGKAWAANHPAGGAVFRFTLPRGAAPPD